MNGARPMTTAGAAGWYEFQTELAVRVIARRASP